MNGSFLHPGELEVTSGPMKSKKSLRMLLRIEPFLYIGGVEFDIFKPDIDTRDPHLLSRFGQQFNNGIAPNLSYSCTFLPSQQPERVFDYVTDKHQFVGFDEAQFFSHDLVGVVEELLERNINVAITGLDYDFRGEPFGPMAELFLRADYTQKLHSVCEHRNESGVVCGQPARWTQRLIDGNPAPYDSPIILVGDVREGYQARCNKHHEVPGRPVPYHNL